MLLTYLLLYRKSRSSALYSVNLLSELTRVILSEIARATIMRSSRSLCLALSESLRVLSKVYSLWNNLDAHYKMELFSSHNRGSLFILQLKTSLIFATMIPCDSRSDKGRPSRTQFTTAAFLSTNCCRNLLTSCLLFTWLIVRFLPISLVLLFLQI